jgi:hypothetical protein
LTSSTLRSRPFCSTAARGFRSYMQCREFLGLQLQCRRTDGRIGLMLRALLHTLRRSDLCSMCQFSFPQVLTLVGVNFSRFIGVCAFSGRRRSRRQRDACGDFGPVRLAYQPPASSTFLSEQTIRSTFPSQQTSISHQPNERAGLLRICRPSLRRCF